MSRRNYLSRLECLVNEIFHLLFGNIFADFFLQLHQPHEHLLVGKTVQGAGQTVHASGK